ncbi:hypothetical protein D9757_002313 [Collybiopsis confluens]|uniref:Uncharacterized protein n=1 Tax=Collybiopsis confluens TaxID=2823264 RepID=A0A8H5I022_9AGAR|nr:hypothetical protein D9757_002313 [Collybiopsis confluens]
MALCMLFPNLEIWEGILITAADVLFLLALKDPLHGRPVRAFELFMAILSSSIVATVAGQAVAEGFLRWRVSAVIRRLFTRIIAIVPAMAVAIALGRPGINALLVASQVVLSITLPFIMLPLLYFTSSKKFMTVKKPRSIVDNANKPVGEDARIPRTDGCNPSPVGDVEASPQSFDLVDFSNGRFTTLIACALWLLVTAANIYVLVTIGTGDA